MLLKLMVSYSSNKCNSIFFFIFFTTFSACKKDIKEAPKKEQELIIYQASEMADLMNEFYEYNESLRSSILNDEDLEQMPEAFLKIHSAKMTDSSGRTPIFNSFAPVFIDAQTKVLDTMSDLDLKSRYNNAINMCLACHKTECVGPIPRIKKLLIKK